LGCVVQRQVREATYRRAQTHRIDLIQGSEEPVARREIIAVSASDPFAKRANLMRRPINDLPRCVAVRSQPGLKFPGV
jgi:hypothetical protein